MSKIQLTDTFAIDGVRRTEDGYLTAFAKVARTGIQQYRGWELGKPSMDVVRVYRPPEEVFSHDAMHSAAHKPLTLRHPPTPVTSKNWKQYSKGQTGSEVVRDGEFIRVPMVMMDSAMIDAYERHGVDQLSLGYSTDIQWESGVVPVGVTDAGMPYDAVQRNIRINHLALVPVARGGDQLRVGDDEMYDRDFSQEQRDKLAKSGDAMPDGSYPIANRGDLENAIRAVGRAKNPAATKAHIKRRAKALGAEDLLPSSWTTDAMSAVCPECGSQMHDGKCPECGYTKDEGEMNMKTIMLDGLTVTVGDDQSASIIQRVVDSFTKKLNDADSEMDNLKKGKKKADQDLDDAMKTISAKDGEIVVLKKQVEDAKVTPERLDAMVKDRLSVIDRAVVILGKDFAFDGKSLDDIRKAAVELKLGDAAKGMDAAAIGGAFAALVADAAAARGGTTPIADAFAARRPGGMQQLNAADAAYEESRKTLESAWKTQTSVTQ